MNPLTYLYAELTCLSSPHPNRKFTVEAPRVAQTNVSYTTLVGRHGQEVEEGRDYPRVREIELLIGFPRFDVRKHGTESRFFIGFPGKSYHSHDAFIAHANQEIKAANRVIGSLLPNSAEIHVLTAVYQMRSSTEMAPIRAEFETGQTVGTAVIDDPSLIDKWNRLISTVENSKGSTVHFLLNLSELDPVVAKCVALISENTYSSFYNVYEVIRHHFGNDHKFKKHPNLNKADLTRFTQTAQQFRHAKWENIGPMMDQAEAKLFVIGLLNIYISDVTGGESIAGA